MASEGLLRVTAKTPREIPRHSIIMLERLGAGHFGGVFKAILDEQTSTGVPQHLVAIKVYRCACALLMFVF